MTESLRILFVQGLQALHTAAERGRDAADDIAAQATADELKEELQRGSEMAERHAALLRECFAAAGEEPQAAPQNEIIDGILAAGRRIMADAPDEAARDAGIIAQGQIALHYHIAAYGTLRAYADELGLEDAAEALDEMVDDCAEQDERYTDLAETLINPVAAGEGDDDEEDEDAAILDEDDATR